MFIDDFLLKHNMRYISVSEGIDTMSSENSTSILTPILSFTNEMYSADISRKINASFKAKMAAGDYIGPFAPYGYKKDTLNKNHLVIDEEAAEVVRKIFSYAKEGYSPNQIAKTLNNEHVLTPLRYRYKMNSHLMQEDNLSEEWSATAVGKILRRETYLGHTIQGKTHRISFKAKYIKNNSKEDWIVVPNTHTPIIDEETWDIVRKKMHSRTQCRDKGFINLFSGIAKCAACGKNMSSTGTHRKGAKAKLVCGGYKLGGTKKCLSHTIDYDLLYNTVLKALREQISFTDRYKKEILDEILEKCCNVNTDKIDKLSTQLATINRKLEQLYDDKYNNSIAIEQFSSLCDRYNTEKTDIEKKLVRLKAEFDEKNNPEIIKERYNKFNDLISRYETLAELDSEILFKLIDRIDVHQRMMKDNISTQQIDIYFKFQMAPNVVKIAPV